MRYFFLTLLKLVIPVACFAAAQPVVYELRRVEAAPRIDGKADDVAWNNAVVASNFITNSPQFGKQASLRTEVKLVYDDAALYIIAHLFDDSPSKMLKTFTARDNVSNVETFFFGFDTYNDDLNGYRFEVTIANVQGDARVSSNNFDRSWDAVWQSATTVTSDGWIAEVKIPYSAIRFPEKQIQKWGVQFGRTIARLGEVDSWSPVDPNISGLVSQWGTTTDITSIKPPLRLSFSPYLSLAWQQDPSVNGYVDQRTINGGMDVKWGINESFTLDMTLVPDFGQVQSDNKVLNLSAFETQFAEKRSFFTEGTELFNQGQADFRDGQLFYSRRVGGTPPGFYDVPYILADNEEIESNPGETQLYNATKITGRTNRGLGIGFFNAVTAPMYAKIRNRETGDIRKYETATLTNYNVFVLDQSLKNNSKISLLNASTLREGNATDGNVTSMNYDIRILKKMYALSGFANYSYRHNKNFVKDPVTGYYYNFIFQKVSGKFRFDLFNSAISKDYNQFDLGYQRARNEMSNFAGASYNINDTKGGPFLNWNTYLSVNYTSRLQPFIYQDVHINTGFNTQLRNQWYVGLYSNIKPAYYYDFYEPRVDGAKYYHAGYEFAGIYINTDSRKRVYFNANLNYGESPVPSDPYKEIFLETNFKATDRLLFAHAVDLSKDESNFGYVDGDALDNIIYGRRDVSTVSNTFVTQYSVASRMTISFRARHYWSKALYLQYYALQPDGSLTNTVYNGNADISFNQFNIDMIFNWEFAPGSYLIAAWKNNISQFDDLTRQDYFKNIDKTYDTPKSNNISIKLIYYLDYLHLRKRNAD